MNDPLKEMWDAWTPVQEQNVRWSDMHFSILMEKQMYEMLQHQSAGLLDKRDAEVIDIISVATNWLRSKYPGMCYADFLQIFSERIRTRHTGQTETIIARDSDDFGPNSTAYAHVSLVAGPGGPPLQVDVSWCDPC